MKVAVVAGAGMKEACRVRGGTSGEACAHKNKHNKADVCVKLRGALGGTTEPDLGSLGRLRVNCIDRGKAPLMAYIYSVRTNRRAGQGLLYKKE